eukprot:gene8694-1558_t
MSADGEAPSFDALKSAVQQALKNRGVLGKYKAELRKSIVDVLNEADPSKPVFKELYNVPELCTMHPFAATQSPAPGVTPSGTKKPAAGEDSFDSGGESVSTADYSDKSNLPLCCRPFEPAASGLSTPFVCAALVMDASSGGVADPDKLSAVKRFS